MKVTLEYDPENYEDLEKARIILDSQKNKVIVDELYNTLIRKYYKHGYSDQRVNEILAGLGPDADYLIEHFNSILKELVGND